MTFESGFLQFVMTGLLIIGVGFAAAFLARRLSSEKWRWFWAGAGIWAAGIVLKMLFAVFANGPVLGLLKSHLAQWEYFSVGALYIGLLTGVFEIGATLVAGLRWPGLASSPQRALMIGAGAGAFQAIVLGLSPLIIGILGLAGVLRPEHPGFADLMKSPMIPFYWLIGPVERVTAILCHTASRIIVLRAVAGRQYASSWPGFLLMTGLDAVTGWAHLSGFMAVHSPWWIELMILPFGVLGFVLAVVSRRRWPEVPEAA